MARVGGPGSPCPRLASWEPAGVEMQRAGASRAEEATGGDLPAVTVPEVP